MARVTITFEDTVGGPYDGSSNVKFDADPPIMVRGDNSPVIETLTLAQKQALVALGAVDSAFKVLTSKTMKMPLIGDAEEEQQVYGD